MMSQQQVLTKYLKMKVRSTSKGTTYVRSTAIPGLVYISSCLLIYLPNWNSALIIDTLLLHGEAIPSYVFYQQYVKQATERLN